MNRLIVDALKSVGLVAAGDDPEARVTFWKSKDEPVSDSPLDEHDMPDMLSNNMNPDGVPKMVDKAESQPDNIGEHMDLSVIEDLDLRKSVEDYIAEKDAEIAALKEEPSDPVENAPDELKELIGKERSEREALQKQLDETIAKQRASEFVGKAEPFKPLLGDPQEIGPVLADLESASPDAYAKLEGALTAAVQRSELADLFKTFGAQGDASADPSDQRDAYVAKQKADGSAKTDAELRADFWKTPEGIEAKQEMRS